MLASVLVLFVAYLIGSIPTGILVGRILGFDPRTVGSGNIGMTNVTRAAGPWAGGLTLAGDLAKGLAPVLAGRALGVTVTGLTLIALAVFLGSIFSIFLGLRGGRGISTGLGIWLGLAPPVVPIVLAVFGLALALSRIVSVGSICAALALAPCVLALAYPKEMVWLALAMAGLAMWRHRHNIGRILRGQEPPFGREHKPVHPDS